jgi:hypothetical protein
MGGHRAHREADVTEERTWFAVESCGEWSATWQIERILGEDEDTSEIQIYRLDGPLDDYERWDMDTKAVVLNASGLDAALHARIDAEAGAFRQRFITDIPGQQMTYLAKEAEARALLAGADPAGAPMIVGGAAARGIEPAEHAAVVIARADAWRALGAKIEIAREAAKAAVSASTTAEGKRAAAVVDWEALLAAEEDQTDG